MVKLRQAVVVEGRYDKNTLSQLIDAPIFETGGFGVMHDEALLALLREAARSRGLIILTDSDGAGFVIRSFLKSALPKEGVLHAYIPALPGKEKRKQQPGKEGLLGVEGMTPEIILKALRDAGAELDGQTAQPHGEAVTKQDLYRLGLSGGAGSREKRLALLRRLGWPQYLSANALLDAVNLRYSREEFFAFVEKEAL